MSVLDRVFRDIQLIIHRYVFDYYYSALKTQYRYFWLNGEALHTANWDDEMECFKYEDDEEANWRHKYDMRPGKTIYRFRILNTHWASSILPKTY